MQSFIDSIKANKDLFNGRLDRVRRHIAGEFKFHLRSNGHPIDSFAFLAYQEILPIVAKVVKRNRNYYDAENGGLSDKALNRISEIVDIYYGLNNEPYEDFLDDLIMITEAKKWGGTY